VKQKTVNAPPTVTVAASPTALEAGGNVTLTATASDPDGSVARVEFYAGTVLLGKDRSVPYGLTWRKVPAGQHVITAVAYDNRGVATRSSPVTVTVSAAPAGTQTQVVATLPMVQALGPGYDGAFEIFLTGQAGDVYDVWYSSDLRNWALLVSVLNADGAVTVSDYATGSSQARFYRASLH
jgi:hypothetical protein